MSYQVSKLSLAVFVAGFLCLVPARMLGQAQAPTTSEPQKNWKDRAEYDLYDAITKDNNATTKLEKLQQWEKQYPTTDYIKERRTLFLTTYAALNKPKEATDAAKQILADNPKDFTGLYYTMYFTQPLFAANPTQTDILDQGVKAANAILANINTPPPNVTTEQWMKLRPDIELMAHVTIGFAAMQKKDWAAAETEFKKCLQMSPNNAQVDYWMGTVIAGQEKPERQSEALFYFARAAAYDGNPGALAPDFRKQAMAYIDRQYKRYHGSADGFNELLALAKSQPTPAPDFHIKSQQEIAQVQQADEQKWAAEHPQEALWKSIKAALTGADGTNYFNTSMKDALLPSLKGKVVKLEPAVRPKIVVLAMEDGANDGTVGDATLKLDAALPGKVEPGTELTFQGVPENFTASPFMVAFNVEKDKLQGWTGKNTPATPTHHPPAKRKATASK